jgi:hypothetical protein
MSSKGQLSILDEARSAVRVFVEALKRLEKEVAGAAPCRRGLLARAAALMAMSEILCDELGGETRNAVRIAALAIREEATELLRGA